MGHGLPGETGVPRVLTEAEQHKLDTWQGLYDELETAAIVLHDLGNPASRAADSLKRGRLHAKGTERRIRETLKAAKP